MQLRPLLFVASVSAAVIAACYSPSGTTAPASSVAPTEGAADSEGASESGASSEANGLPCDVSELLTQRCQSCHGRAPKKAPMALMTYEDLVAEAPSDTAKTVAEVSLERMQSTDQPMPPGKGRKATSSEIEAFAAWIEAGYPRGSCASAEDPGGAPTDASSDAKPSPDAGASDASAPPTASVCTSNTMWTSSEKSARMNPGKACITCHTAVAGGPILQVGGTVYPSLHEPDKCYGAAGASVVITDAKNRTVTLKTGETGNFALRANATALAFPIKVKVVHNGVERAMSGSPPNGDCNSCHTESGAHSAPGRIMLP